LKNLFLFFTFLFPFLSCFGQAYIPMPADSAVWRYRIYDIDYITQINDFILFSRGQDTIANGHVYHQIFSRSSMQTGGIGFNPPIVTTEANLPDLYYGAIRDSNKMVYLLEGSGEELMFDFNAGIGDSVPANAGKIKVTGIDSVLLGSEFHKRYHTTDSLFYLIEGVGSSEGLLPSIVDGSGAVVFYCFTYNTETFIPDTIYPCTYIYPEGYYEAVWGVNISSGDLNIYPLPASEFIHFNVPLGKSFDGEIFNALGGRVWKGIIATYSDLEVVKWPRGIYYGKFTFDAGQCIVKKIIIE